MKTVGLYRYLPIDRPEALLDLELPTPQPGPHDLLVRVHAVSVNPVDYKVRAPKDKTEAMPRILGWDAAGEVVAIGSSVSLFAPGDRVYYAGDITRAGSNAEFQLVDERIAGPMPETLGFAEAAALPLTAITAWEALFDRLRIATPPHSQPDKTLLVIGGAGGVGSIAIQLATRLAGLTVIGTASRPDSQAWVRELGALHVIDHHQDMVTQLAERGITQVDYVFITQHAAQHFPVAAQLIAPQGGIVVIESETSEIDVSLLKSKSASLHWEFMFTRSMYQTADMQAQHQLLAALARLVDLGVIRSTLQAVTRPLNADTVRAAHAALEQGQTIGKRVIQVID